VTITNINQYRSHHERETKMVKTFGRRIEREDREAKVQIKIRERDQG
jgi:hypothetical protein